MAGLMPTLTHVATTIAICVPLRNERRNVAGLIKAIGAQDPGLLSATILILLFDGADPEAQKAAADTFAGVPMVRGMIRDIERHTLPNAGRARRAAMSAGLAMLGDDGVLLTTDADTRPDADWLSASVAALRSCDLVCGHIRRRDPKRDRWREAIETYLDRLAEVRAAVDPIACDPAPRHWNEGGASLGVRVDAYRKVGGVPEIPTGEDRALVDAVRRAGLRVRHDPAVRVATSSRAGGRATGGLADAIRAGRLAVNTEQMVEHPASVIERFRREAAIRRAFATGEGAAAFGLDAATVTAAACAEDLFRHVRGTPGDPLPLPMAMQILEQYREAEAA